MSGFLAGMFLGSSIMLGIEVSVYGAPELYADWRRARGLNLEEEYRKFREPCGRCGHPHFPEETDLLALGIQCNGPFTRRHYEKFLRERGWTPENLARKAYGLA